MFNPYFSIVPVVVVVGGLYNFYGTGELFLVGLPIALATKLIFSKSHLMKMLLILEMLLVVCLMATIINLGQNCTMLWVLLLMVMMVSGACFGLSLMISITRLSSKETTISY